MRSSPTHQREITPILGWIVVFFIGLPAMTLGLAIGLTYLIFD